MMANSPPTRSQPHPFRSELALKAPPSSSSSQSRADRHHCRAGARLHVEAHLRPSSGQASRRNEFHSTHSTFPSRSPTSSVVTSPESGRHRRASPLLRRRTTPVDLRPRILRQTESELADGNYTLVRELVEEEVHNGEVNALVTEQVPQDPEPNCEQEGKHRSMT